MAPAQALISRVKRNVTLFDRYLRVQIGDFRHRGMHQSNVRFNWKLPGFPSELISSLHKQWDEILHQKEHKPNWDRADQELIKTIRSETSTYNRNNRTRTKAYYDMYSKHPQLHWAFLAHMVSRNGGWSMTDLKGEFAPHLLTQKEQEAFCTLLEACNAHIFQDAFPQLLLYHYSINRREDLFYLLPAFQISFFMWPIWHAFWRNKNARLLTHSLIINEQHLIESTVMQVPWFQENVLNTLAFQAQGLLRLTPVLLPYFNHVNKMRLAGVYMDDFTQLKERIETGQTLYNILFGYEDVYKGAKQWAKQHAHTASRADYWPQIFTNQLPNDQPSSALSYQPKLKGYHLKNDHDPLNSPELEQSWQDTRLAQSAHVDWYHGQNLQPYFSPAPLPRTYDITKPYILMLNRMEVAVYIKDKL